MERKKDETKTKERRMKFQITTFTSVTWTKFEDFPSPFHFPQHYSYIANNKID